MQKARLYFSDKQSIDYYDQNVETYFNETVCLDMTEQRELFLAQIPLGGRIMDAGCGSGRDSKYFFERGYKVIAFDGSVEMAEKASRLLGFEVQHLLFEDISFEAEFDGIWACASLLHVPRQNLPEIFSRLSFALKINGIIYVSFKSGDNERRKDDGRYFCDLTQDKLSVILSNIPGLHTIKYWHTKDIRPERSHEKWLNCLIKRVG